MVSLVFRLRSADRSCACLRAHSQLPSASFAFPLQQTLHSLEMSDSDSPPPKGRKPLPTPPILTPSPGSDARSVGARVKRAVPPSPGSGVPSVDSEESSLIEADSPVSRQDLPRRLQRREQRIQTSRRQQQLTNPFLDLQAKEGEEGDSVSGSENSEDDRYNPRLPLQFSQMLTSLLIHRHLPDLSYLTQGKRFVPAVVLTFTCADFNVTSTSGSYSDGDPALYMQSMGSQAEDLGFGTPLHQLRRGTFRCVHFFNVFHRINSNIAIRPLPLQIIVRP